MFRELKGPLNEVTKLQELTSAKSWRYDGAICLKGWVVEHTAQPSDEIALPALDNHMLVTLIPRFNRVERQFSRFAGLEYDGSGLDKEFFIVPAGTPSEFAWSDAYFGACFDISPQALHKTAIETECIKADEIELKPVVLARDAQITRLTRCLLHEIRQGGPGGKIYAESIKTCFNLHLLRHYCTYTAKVKDYAGGLAPYCLREVLEYIDNNLTSDDLSLSGMAQVTNLSNYYFSRQFKRSTGLAPYQYVTQQRIDRAKRLLKQRQLAISEIALRCGFSNQSHLSRVFKRSVGTTPKRYQRQS